VHHSLGEAPAERPNEVGKEIPRHHPRMVVGDAAIPTSDKPDIDPP